MRESLSTLAERLVKELPQRRVPWQGIAMLKAGRLLVNVGAIDMAASLAYFATLSLFPLIALQLMAIVSLDDSGQARDVFIGALAYYFPTSEALIRQAINSMLSASLAISVISVVSLLIGANGIFSSANRAVGRIFEQTGFSIVSMTKATFRQTVIATLLAILFLFSVGLTVALHAAIGFSHGLIEATGGFSISLLIVLGVASAAIPLLATTSIFIGVYRYLPNTAVQWRESAFGAIIAVTLFELTKHLFLWLGNILAQRSVIYGPLASFVLLLIWLFVSGLVFLYGIALTRTAGETRPHTLSNTP